MEEKNIALLGFVSSAADYLREQIKDDGEEIKTLEEVDLNKIKSELENKLGSSFDGAKNKSDDLINAGREVFDNFISKSPTLIDEFKDIFDVDFKKENDEKDEEIVSHLINILKRPQENDETDDLVNQIAKAASKASSDYKSKVVVNNTCEDKELDSIFSEILANENIEEELPETDGKDFKEKTDSNPEESKLDPNEIKQLIKDTISEFFNDKKQETEIKLDEIIDSFDVLKNVSENKDEQISFTASQDTAIQSDDESNKVDSSQETEETVEKENATIDDIFADQDEQTDTLDSIDVLSDEIIDSFDALKNVFENKDEQISFAASQDTAIQSDDVSNKVDSNQETEETVEKENATIDDIFADQDEQTDTLDSIDVSSDEISDSSTDSKHVNYESSYEEPVRKENKNNNVEEEIVLNDFNVEEAIEKEFLEILNRKAEKEELKKANDDYAFVDGVLVNDSDLLERNKENEETLNSDVDKHEDIEEDQIEDKDDLEESEELDDSFDVLKNVFENKDEQISFTASQDTAIQEDDASNKVDSSQETEETVEKENAAINDIFADEDELEDEQTDTSDFIDVSSEEINDEVLADEPSEDSVSLFDDVPLSKKLTSFTDKYEPSTNANYKDEDLSFDKDDEAEAEEKEDSISSFLKELKENKEEDLSEETSGIIADLIDDKTINKETETENEPIIIENDYVEAYNNRSLEEMYIPNPGLNALENEVEDDSDLVEETNEETESNEDSYLNDLFDEFTNNDFEVDDISDKQKQEEATKKEIFDSIVTLYPYLSNGFIKGVYDLKQSFVNDYKDGEKIIILHRLHFEDINGLRQFVDVMIEHGYLVNVDEKQMIVDTFKEHINSDGKILTDIFEIANQGKLLTGDYEGYRIIEDEL